MAGAERGLVGFVGSWGVGGSWASWGACCWCFREACGICGFGGVRVKLVAFFGVRGARGLVEFVGLLRCARRTEPVRLRDCPWRRYGTLFWCLDRGPKDTRYYFDTFWYFWYFWYFLILFWYFSDTLVSCLNISDTILIFFWYFSDTFDIFDTFLILFWHSGFVSRMCWYYFDTLACLCLPRSLIVDTFPKNDFPWRRSGTLFWHSDCAPNHTRYFFDTFLILFWYVWYFFDTFLILFWYSGFVSRMCWYYFDTLPWALRLPDTILTLSLHMSFVLTPLVILPASSWNLMTLFWYFPKIALPWRFPLRYRGRGLLI